MKLIVGLGNPGKEYENTRHNVGFAFLDFYLDKKEFNVLWRKKFNALFFETNINSEKVIFVKPQTYMNLSGKSVKSFLDYYHISIDDLLIISDDLDLNLGNFKLKSSGSSGGHNGLKNIELLIGSDKYKRLKIGISKSNLISTKDYVLGKMSIDDKVLLYDTFHILVSVLNDFFIMSFDSLMCKYNRKNR